MIFILFNEKWFIDYIRSYKLYFLRLIYDGLKGNIKQYKFDNIIEKQYIISFDNMYDMFVLLFYSLYRYSYTCQFIYKYIFLFIFIDINFKMNFS